MLLKDIKEKATVIKEKTDDAQKKATEVEAEAAMIYEFAKKVEGEKAMAEEELEKSKPILEEALKVREKFIPTPMKFTYNFTLKDNSKIMLGALRTCRSCRTPTRT